MKCRALKAFADKNDNAIIYEVGAVLDFDEKRAAAASANGLVEIIEEKKKPAPQAKASAPKKQAKK